MMECIVGKLQKQGVLMALFLLVLLHTGCEEHFDRSTVNPPEGEMVEVSLNIGFADEADGYDLSASTKAASSCKDAFDVDLIPAIKTRATSLKPNSLYKLEIRQYKTDGTYLGGIDPTDRTIGTAFTASLTAAQNCQLVFVAWGQNSTKKLGTGNLASAQAVVLDNTDINNLSPTDQTDMNKMPYVLHLKNVNITSGGKISSPDGEDVRVLLQRLATRLNISWSYNASGYTLSQIILQSIPLNYKVVAAPDATANNTYPSLLDQYTDIPLTDAEVRQGSYSRWIPANVRGINTESNAPQYRIKRNAPLGSSYASFIAVNSTDSKKKLNYRVYLGGKDYSDYNLIENTDYSYTIRFTHTTLPVDDNRITIIDPIPASENNENFLPTANCFMVAPGGAFCFDPYVFYQKGTKIDNPYLTGSTGSWCTRGGITKVELLWQTKENGDLGDPVMGVVNSATDHSNIVELKNQRIYCRVAPNTTGGSGLIVVKNSSGTIVWSWHIWVTSYNPSATLDASVDDPDKRIQKYTHGNSVPHYPMMDRNLGAMAGYTDVPATELEKSKANGFHYQWGRKDPFPSSYTNKEEKKPVTLYSDKPTPGMLNLYGVDGYTFLPRKSSATAVSRAVSCQNPTTSYSVAGPRRWCSDAWDENWWGKNGKKTLHDPCPAGWRVSCEKNYLSLFQDVSYSGSTNTHAVVPMNLANPSTVSRDGGILAYFEGSSISSRKTYIRLTGYHRYPTQFYYIGTMCNLWCSGSATANGAYALVYSIGGVTDWNVAHNVTGTWAVTDAHTLRCVQDRQ